MDNAFVDLLEFATRAGIEVRHAHLGGSSGALAQTRSKRILFIDLDAPAMDQLQQTARALAALPEIQTQFLRPDLRALLEQWTPDQQS